MSGLHTGAVHTRLGQCIEGWGLGFSSLHYTREMDEDKLRYEYSLGILVGVVKNKVSRQVGRYVCKHVGR